MKKGIRGAFLWAMNMLPQGLSSCTGYGDRKKFSLSYLNVPHMEEYIRALSEDDMPDEYGISGSGKQEVIR